MGSGAWTSSSFANYSTSRGRSYDHDTGALRGDYSAQDMFKQRRIAEELNPKNVIRECCDSSEHPNTIPVILGLDVTGSMGSSAVEVAKKLSVVMTELYNKVKDVEFLVMGIGDLAYDNAPIQASQFESDIRIAEQLDKVYFEGGGGGNSYESYTAAWYFGSRHAKLDCWGRGKKGIIITMGDEPLNPYLPRVPLERATGDNLQGDVETSDLYREASEKYDIYHLNVDHRSYSHYDEEINSSFGKYLDSKHLRKVNLNSIADEIIDIIVSAVEGQTISVNETVGEQGSGISW